MENVRAKYGDKITFAKDEYSCLDGADSLIIATEWALFRTPDFKKITSKLKEKVIFDGRNLYDIDEMKQLDFFYASVGREIVEPVNVKQS
jgi:UDPglucose 6-dehydrogenase